MPENLKIAFVLDDSLDKPDGVQQYVLTLGAWLHEQGHEVHYLVGESKRRDVANVHSLARNFRVKFNQNRMSIPLPANKRAIRTLLQEEKFDVLHVQMPYSPMLAARIIKAAPPGTAIIGTFHIIPISWVERTATHLLGIWLTRNLKRFDKFFAVSLPALKFAKESFGISPTVLPNVVALEAFSKGKRRGQFTSGKFTILFLGRLVRRKGAMYFLQAIWRLQEHGSLKGARVLVAGKGPFDSELKRFVKDNQLQDRVSFLGFVPEADKPDLLASADIAVFPSIGGESFGIVLIEAMAAGSGVVIGGANPGYRSVLGERPDHLVDPKDSASFALALENFMTNQVARADAARWQAHIVKDYDVATVGAELVEHYRDALNHKRNVR